MHKIVWWQFSDLHWPAAPVPERKAFATQLIAGIQDTVLPKHGVPDAIFFTGDIAHSGSAAEYQSAAECFVEPLRRIAGESTPLFMVPGNHDLSRVQAENLNADRITAISTPAQLDALLDDKRARQLYLTPFDEFSLFAERYAVRECADALLWQVTREIKDLKVQIAGLNSAWSSYYPIRAGSETDDRHLLLAACQLPPVDPDAAYRILLMHHPFDWMNRELCSRVEQTIRRQFDIVLFGHVHSPRDLSLVTTPGSNCLLLPSPLLYSRPYDDSIEFARGFVVGSLDTGAGSCEVSYYRYGDAFGPARIVPYVDLYPEGVDRFTAHLRTRVGNDRREAALDGPADFRLPDAALASLFVQQVRSLYVDHSHVTALSYCLAIFGELVRLLTSRFVVFSAMHADCASAAFLATEIRLVRALSERGVGVNRAGVAAAHAAFGNARQALLSISSADFALLVRFLDEERADTSENLARHVIPSTHQASLLFATLWSIARYVLAFNTPDADDLAHGEAGGGGGNIINVRATEEGVLVFRLGTATREAFHRVAEARHEADEYVSEVEDLWRRAGLIAPPVSVRLEFPMWRQRSVDSFYLQVEAKPIARLLMGKALYGGREHVWLRELLQNAVDATEMRRTTIGAPNYDPRITIQLVNGNEVLIHDNGVGMDRQHIVRYLATLGRSGWRANESDQSLPAGTSFFGRFGIGFASVFNVARRVHVKTRRVGSRSVDGWLVQFSDPERPYFVEPLVCEEGTSITVTLIDEVSPATFSRSLADLFVYLPPFIQVDPSTDLPKSLDEVSIAQRFPNHFEVVARTAREVTLGAHDMALALELGIPSLRRRTTTGEVPRTPPETALTVAVDGIRVFDQVGLRIDPSGKPKPEADWNWRRTRDQGLKNCFATLDFRRELSPVTPSRDAISVDSVFLDRLRLEIDNQAFELIRELFHKLCAHDDEESARTAFTRIIENVTRDRESWESPGTLSCSEQFLRKIAALYLEDCPVLLRSDKGTRQLQRLNKIDPATCNTAVLERINETSSFSVYARVAGLRYWIVPASHSELGILQAAWPFKSPLRVIASSEQLFQRHDVILPEVRTMKLCRLIRGDYALSSSPIFEGALFVHLPTNVQPVARHVGAAKRRSQMDSSQPPRVVLNAAHELSVGLEEFLSKADEPHIQQLGTWLDSFCDGVIEDKTKLAPTARWNRLVEDLRGLTGIDLRNTSVDKLRLTV